MGSTSYPYTKGDITVTHTQTIASATWTKVTLPTGFANVARVEMTTPASVEMFVNKFEINEVVVNVIPTITSAPTPTVNVDANYSYTPTATNPNNGTLTWAVKSGTSLPAGLSLNDSVDSSSNMFVNVGTAGFSTNLAKYTSIALDSNNTPYVVYKDGDDDDDSKATVKKFDGTTWVDVGTAGLSVGGAIYTSIALDSNNNPYVAYKDVEANDHITVMKFNGTTWELVGDAGFSDDEIFYTSIVLDNNNIPYVVYQDAVEDSNDGATVKKFNGTAWELVGDAGFSAGKASYTTLALDSNNTLYVVYQDVSNDNKATLMKFNGTAWELVGDAGFSDGEAKYTSIALDSTNAPYVLYQDVSNGNKATLMKFNGTAWELVGDAGFSAGAVKYTSLLLDSTNNPYMVYQDGSNNNKATVMKLSTTTKLIGNPTEVGVHNVNLTLSDGTNTVEHNFQLTVVGINHAPTNIALTPATLAKNAPMGTTVGTLSATDADSGDTHTYAFTCTTAGTNDMNFVINGASLSSAYNFAGVTATSQSICVRVTDSASATYDKNITIALTDVTPPSGGSGGGGGSSGTTTPPVVTPPVLSPNEIKIIVAQPTTGGTSGLENKTVIINEIVTGTSSVGVGTPQTDSATNTVSTPITLSSTTGTQTVVAIKTAATPIVTTTGEGVELKTTTTAVNGTTTASTIKVFNNGTTQTTSVKTTPTGEVITNTIQSLRTDTQTQEDAQGNTQTSFVTGSTTTTCKTTSSGTTVHEVSTLNPLTGVTSTTQATSKVNGSVVTLREDGVVQTNAQLTSSNGDTQVIVVEALANGGSKNIVQFTATNGKVTTTSSSSALMGTQTTIEADGNINNSVAFGTNTTLSSNQKADGTLSTQLQNRDTGKVTQTSSLIAGSSVDIDENGNMNTSSVIEKDGFIYKAVALNNADGTTTTKIVKTNATTGVEIQSANTTKTPYEAGNSVEMSQIGGVIYIKTTAPVNADLVIE